MRFRFWAGAIVFSVSAAYTSNLSAQVAAGTPYYRIVEAGRSLRVDAFSAMNPDCTSRGRTTASLIEAPHGGQVSIGEGYEFPNYVAGNPRSACDRHRVRQTILGYRSVPGFVGQDQFTVELQFPDGLARTVRYFVNVRPSERAASAESTASGSRQVAKCANEAGLVSLRSVVPTRLSVANYSSEPRTIYWLNFQRARVRYGTVEPGTKLAFNTYLTHPWLIAGPSDACLRVVMPKPLGSVVAIR